MSERPGFSDQVPDEHPEQSGKTGLITECHSDLQRETNDLPSDSADVEIDEGQMQTSQLSVLKN